MKKYFKLLLIVAILIIAIIVVKKILTPEYTLNEVIDLINPKIIDNMYVKVSYNSAESIEEYYVKNKIIYQKHTLNGELAQEFLFDTNSNKQTNIFHYSKEIYFFENSKSLEEIMKNILKEELLETEDAKETYEYLGKENVDGTECIKCSIIYEDGFIDIPEKVKIIFYISEENKRIEKEEIYTIRENNFELYNTTEYEYSYNTVVDENILNFDLESYPDYRIIEE